MPAKPALGAFPVGTVAIGSTTTHDNPVPALVAPVTTVSSGGPNLTVQWSYTQAQSDPQAWYRVLLVNDAGSSTFYDSGWLAGAVTSHTFDAIAAGVDPDTTDLAVIVQVRSDEGEFWQGATTLAQFDLQWGLPSVTITAPVEAAVVLTDTVTISWSYSDLRSIAQGAFRVRLKYRDSGLYLYDSGFVASAATSHVVAFILSDLSRYTLELQVKNAQQVPSDVESVHVTTDLGSTAPTTTLDTVGKLYEIGINGVGYMLYDNRDAEADYQYQRAVVPLDPQRFVTGSTPLSQAIEHYLFSINSDFKGGAGQQFSDRNDAAADAYLDSQGVNPFDRGRVTLLNSSARELSSVYASLRLEVVSDVLYVQTGANQLKAVTAPGASPSTFSVAAATTITDLTSDGVNWYAAAGAAGVFRNSTAADPGAVWSATLADLIGWAGNRVCAALKAGTSSTPNRFTTLNDSGLEEVSGGRLTLPDGWSITDFAGGSGFVFVSAYSGIDGVIYAWNLTTDAPFVALNLPRGDVPIAITWYQGQVVVAARRPLTSSMSKLVIYRCPVDSSGALSLTTVVEVGDSTANWGAVNSIIGIGRFVLFGWPSQDDTTSGLGAIDLSTGGYAKWFRATATLGDVASLGVWQGRVVFAVRGDGIWLQSADAYETSGYLATSIADGNSGLSKVVDSVSLSTFPLGAGESLSLESTLDGGNSYTAVADSTLSGAGAKARTTDIDQQTPSIGLRVTLTGPGTSTPVLYQVGLRYHMIGVADELVQLPIDCGDEVGLLNERPDPNNGPGHGALRAQLLQGLIQSRVLFQDVDFQFTGLAEIFEVQQVQVRKSSMYERASGRNALRMVAVVTLRRRAK